MEIKKALLLNPPGDQKYLRDYFCSTVSKTGYYWHPIDLLIQSGFLARHFDIKVIDAIAQNLSSEDTYKGIILFKPDIILLLTSVLSIKMDMEFLQSLKQSMPGSHIFLAGEPFIEESDKLMKTYSFIDGALLSFIYDDITAFEDHRFEDIKAMVFRDKGVIVSRYDVIKNGTFSMPMPKHELFPLNKYWMPFIMHHPFASVLTTYGCPFVCSYCNSGADTTGFLVREAGEVVDEIKYIKSLGIQHIFIKDMTFGVPRNHAIHLCEEIIKQDINITWHCYSRTDVVDGELLQLMKRAGCNLIQFGVETSSESTLKKYNKNIPLYKTIQAFELVHKHAILTGAHFIFGLPGESLIDMKKTVELAKSLRPAYVSFNIATPRYRTPLRNELMGDNSTNEIFQDGIKKFVKKANIDFYMRPLYFAHLLSQIKTITQLESILRESSGMVRYLLKN